MLRIEDPCFGEKKGNPWTIENQTRLCSWVALFSNKKKGWVAQLACQTNVGLQSRVSVSRRFFFFWCVATGDIFSCPVRGAAASRAHDAQNLPRCGPAFSGRKRSAAPIAHGPNNGPHTKEKKNYMRQYRITNVA